MDSDGYKKQQDAYVLLDIFSLHVYNFFDRCNAQPCSAETQASIISICFFYIFLPRWKFFFVYYRFKGAARSRHKTRVRDEYQRNSKLADVSSEECYIFHPTNIPQIMPYKFIAFMNSN